MEIRVDDLRGEKIIRLLEGHVAHLRTLSPPCSVHALDVQRLRKPEITFWSVWEGTELVGCGALKELDWTHGEIKSMRTVAAHLRKGIASKMVTHILDEAKRRGYRRLFLTTGSKQPEAAALYLATGYHSLDTSALNPEGYGLLAFEKDLQRLPKATCPAVR